MKRINLLSRRAISPIVATVLLIALVSAASSIAAYIILNINETKLPFLEQHQSVNQTVALSFSLDIINDTDSDGRYDFISFKLSLNIDSPIIYVRDVDIVLKTGQTLDNYCPWMITTSTQNWNEEMGGHVISSGTINATFTIQTTDLSNNNAELIPGQQFYLLISYYFQVETGYRTRTTIGFYETTTIVAP